MQDDNESGLGTDQAGFQHFTGPQRLEAAMNALHGIVCGITADHQVNSKELSSLAIWLGRYREFADRHPFNEVIPRLQQSRTKEPRRSANEEISLPR